MAKRKRKGLLGFIGRLFHRRNIIIVSDNSVEHYPFDYKVQGFIFLIVVMGFSWLSYSTGNYMAAKQMLHQKQIQLMSSEEQARMLDEKYSLLKHDLQKMQDVKGELSEYAQFVLEQHSSTMEEDGALSTEGESKLDAMKADLLERITFLEENVVRLAQEKEYILRIVTEHTKTKIQELNDLISSTGVNAKRLSSKARDQYDIPNIDDKMDEMSGSVGGPFVPDTIAEMSPQLVKQLDDVYLLEKVVANLPLATPVDNARLSSRFGRRYDPFSRRPALHSGLDFVGKHGAHIRATAPGRVTVAKRRGSYGNYVEIDHGLGLTTRYGHLKEIKVRAGQRVKKGAIIGAQGSTGRSTGSHLHYEVRYHGKALNPMKFVKAGKNVQFSE